MFAKLVYLAIKLNMENETKWAVEKFIAFIRKNREDSISFI